MATQVIERREDVRAQKIEHSKDVKMSVKGELREIEAWNELRETKRHPRGL